MSSISLEQRAKLNALVAAFKKSKEAAREILAEAFPSPSETLSEISQEIQPVQEISSIQEISQTNNTIFDRYGNLITLNSKQLEFISLVKENKSAVLIGAAGTGKTTCQKAATQALIDNGLAGILHADGHKHLKSGTPGIVICAFTRRAVANIRKNVSLDLQANCITIHKLLEYQPVIYEITDPETGKQRKTMAFEPARNALNTLPSSINVLILEETSMLGTDLFEKLMDALPHKPQIIYLGDIQQLPPIFGPAILGFKLLEHPVIELTEVYRQALESPIISLAHRILSGNPLPATESLTLNKPPLLKIHHWKKRIHPEDAITVLANFFTKAITTSSYDPYEDIILIPFNKSCGTDELNLHIANYLARKNKVTTYQIIAGFNKKHFSPGERILYDKEDATIISIEENPAYTGVIPTQESTTLDYWGYDPEHTKEKLTDKTDDDIDILLARMASASTDSKERVRQSSHIIKIQMADSDTVISLNTASDINSILYGYALTVHKAQGSEWRRVFFIIHHSHATMTQRELLYTAVTRAKEELYIICEPDTFVKGITSQRVIGNTLEEKAQFFMGKLS